MNIHINHILIFILFLSILVYSKQQNTTYLKQQYIKDIQHLNDKIISFQSNPSNQVNVTQMPNLTQGVYKTIQFEPQIIYLEQNQFAQFSYPNIQDNLIDIRIKQTFINEKDIQLYKTASDNYYKNKQAFNQTLNNNNQKSCKVNDPQIQLRNLITKFLATYFVKSYNQLPLPLVYLNPYGQYHALRYNGLSFETFKLRVDDGNKYYNVSQIQQLSQIRLQQIIQNKQIYLFLIQNYIKLAYSKGKFWIIKQNNQTFNLSIQLYAQISQINNQYQSNNQIIQNNQPNNQTNQNNQQSNHQNNQNNQQNNHQQQQQQQQQQIQNIIALKYGFLIQYQTYFQIYTESQNSLLQNQQPSQNNTQSIKQFIPKISIPQLKKITNSKPIISISVTQQLSHQSGYKIYLLLQSHILIQLQYGSYSSITQYQIPYGQHFHHLTVNEDIVQIIFSITKSKMPYYYGMQLFIDRKQNPRSPKMHINRFYNDLKDINKIQFLNGKQLMIIGNSDVLIYDWPINSKVLIKQNITQYPYHFAVQNFQKVYMLDKFSTNQAYYVLLMAQSDMSIAKLTRKQQTIECSSDKSFDTRIQILKYCDQSRNQLCKYIGSLRVLIQNSDSERIKSLKIYLIIGLIIALSISICIVMKQICQNKRTIQKLRKLKQRINKKYNQMQNKGKRLQDDQKFSQLQQEAVQDGKTKNKKSSSQIQKSQQQQ